LWPRPAISRAYGPQNGLNMPPEAEPEAENGNGANGTGMPMTAAKPAPLRAASHGSIVVRPEATTAYK
jgi:hypothetical protein